MARRIITLVLVSLLLTLITLVSAQSGRGASGEIERDVVVFLHESVSRETEEGCGITGERSQARLRIESTPRGLKIVRSLSDSGRLVDADESPINEPGCLFEFEVELSEAREYLFRVGQTELAVLPFEVLEDMDGPLVLAMDQDGARTTLPDGTAAPTPRPTSAPRPTPTPLPPTPTPIPGPEAGRIDRDTYRIVGTFILRSDGVVNTSYGCYGTGGFSDVSDGAQIIVRDGNNNILGVGRLQDTDLSSSFSCNYTFTLEVPETDFYQIEFSHRSPLVYTFEEMELMGWALWLSLGG